MVFRILQSSWNWVLRLVVDWARIFLGRDKIKPLQKKVRVGSRVKDYKPISTFITHSIGSIQFGRTLTRCWTCWNIKFKVSRCLKSHSWIFIVWSMLCNVGIILLSASVPSSSKLFNYLIIKKLFHYIVVEEYFIS